MLTEKVHQVMLISTQNVREPVVVQPRNELEGNYINYGIIYGFAGTRQQMFPPYTVWLALVVFCHAQ